MNIPLNIDWQQILLHLFNFVILFAILYFILYSPVKKFMDKRVQYYKDLDNEANQKMKDSAEREKKYADKLSAVDCEIAEKKKEANVIISKKIEESEKQAKEKADEIISAARMQAQNERKKIIEDAQREIADMVAEATEKIIGKNTSESYDQFLNAAERENEND